MLQVAFSLGHDYQTAGFTGMVNACEALKPPDLLFRDHNIYHVAEALLGKARADMLQEDWFRPQAARVGLWTSPSDRWGDRRRAAWR
jgi:hypothetical protein